jgi:flavin reductase (DIM6/NTAB) family NADH-FMN oxidoreductase RutF
MSTTFDQVAFRQSLGQFPTGVCVATCLSNDEPVGMTITSFNSLSLDPPLILFSIGRRAASLPLWEIADRYIINVLAENQGALADRFAKRLSNKWQGARWSGESAEGPILLGVAAWFSCAPFARHDGGDHRLFIGEVKRFSCHAERRPLVFCKSRYLALQEAEPAAPPWPLDIHY